MDIVYTKSEKGISEIQTRQEGLERNLRPYLIVVDGIKSVKSLTTLNPVLKDMPVVLAQLHDQGYLETSSTRHLR